MRMYQDERRLDFHALGREIKRKREAKGWTQEYLAQLVDRTPRSICLMLRKKLFTVFWCCTIKVDIENSKGQYIEKDKQEATKDGSESTKIQHGI